MISCNDKQNKVTKSIKYPNKTSEMAQLMRQMTTKLDSIKTKFDRNELIELNLLNFPSIYNQKTTDASFDKPHIQPMSKSFELSAHNFNKQPTKDNYSILINNCIGCHQLSCPGPLMKINKLKINYWAFNQKSRVLF